MLNSECFRDRKGVLAAVRVAAYCPKRLSKQLVDQTNIPSVVDTILQDQVSIVAYRVLSFLLLGVVRIYSKKIQYTCDDCKYLRSELNECVGRKKISTSDEAVCAPYLTITLPNSFQLDAFDLQISEERTGVHVRSSEVLVFKDARKETVHAYHSPDKNYSLNDGLSFQSSPATFSPFADVLSLSFREHEVMTTPRRFCSLEASIEKFGDNSSFFHDEILEPIIPGVVEQEPQRNDEEEMRVPNDEAFVGVEGMDMVEQTVFPEMVSPQNTVSITVDVTPKSRVTIGLGTPTPAFMAVLTPASTECGRVSRKRTPAFVAVQTPASTECGRVSRKRMPTFTSFETPSSTECVRVSKKRRRCLVDDIIVLPNRIIKESIADPSDLVRERRRVPHTRLHVWRTQKLSSLPHSLFEPLIPCLSEIGSVISNKKLKKIQVVKATIAPEKTNIADHPIGHLTPDQALNYIPESRIIHQSPDQADIAPSTPISRSTSSKLHDCPRLNICSDSAEEEHVDNSETDTDQINEAKNSSAGDCWEMNKWSVRTRAAATCLCRNFSSRRKLKEDEVAKLFQILEGKNKTESARMFYEILVLKSGGYVDVKQQAPYDDIVVEGTSKLKELRDF